MIAHDIIVRPIITEKSMLGAVNKVSSSAVRAETTAATPRAGRKPSSP